MERCIMLLQSSTFNVILLITSVFSGSQINLYWTDDTIDKINDATIQHSCLYIATSINDEKNARHIIPYCISESLSNWHIQQQNFNRIFTFDELRKNQITSQHLYMWSAPMDIVERYQYYLNQFVFSSKISMSTQLFYNCTFPYFGPICQYSIDNYEHQNSSVNEAIVQFYSVSHKPITFTCYTYLKCNRGLTPSCLDWSEICDGKIDCIDDGHDEEDCWQLEINSCEANEYRCSNGQCIPHAFFRDDSLVPDCLDGSDEILKFLDKRDQCDTNEPTFACEDVVCSLNPHYFKSPLTSSCMKHRSEVLLHTMFSKKPDFISDACWSAFMCILHIGNISVQNSCLSPCNDSTCSGIIRTTCPDMLYLPPVPVVFNQVYFAYTNRNAYFSQLSSYAPNYICFRDQLCSEYFEKYEYILFNNSKCYRPDDLGLELFPGRNTWIHLYVSPVFELVHKCYTIINNSSMQCNKSNLYQCMNSSKCIHQNRLNDGIVDCFYHDDEQFRINHDNYLSKRVEQHFKCRQTNTYISYRLVDDGQCHCIEYENHLCDDEFSKAYYSRTHISFQTICDGFTELIPLMVDGRNQTDETDCEQWQCNNTYTRCNSFWNCLDGSDEVNCDSSSLLSCPFHHHICVSPTTRRLQCLPIKKANDGRIDCLGATDEPILCREKHYLATDTNFYCKNDSRRTCINSMYLCDRDYDCEYGDDEQVCDTNRNFTSYYSVCYNQFIEKRSDVEKFLCERLIDTHKQQIVYFSLITDRNVTTKTIKLDKKETSLRSLIHPTHERCNRGFSLRVWLDKDKNLTRLICLCPPSYYGDICQYQSQRVSLTMQYRAFSDAWRTPFVIVVMLVDDSHERTIHSHALFTYLPMRDCQIKFHTYLLYSTRPKNHSNNYSVHINIYEKMSLTYHGSWLLPLRFSFLPVHRLAVQLDIPRTLNSIEHCSDKNCVHGDCVKYSNKPNYSVTFCRCNAGWSGLFCTIPYTCTCAFDSLCIGTLTNNRSLCVCPINRFGPHCLLKNTLCEPDQNTICLNGGQCIPIDEYLNNERRFTCICSKGFSGDRCEIVDGQIVLSFDKEVQLPQALLVHFIRVITNAPPERATTFKLINFHQNSITINWPHPFHVIFVELFNKSYYLAVIQNTFQPSTTITRKILPTDRCKHINELFNEEITQLHLLRRIKYYHEPCQWDSPKLSCFYDDVHLCLCGDHGSHRVANCFEFDHQMKSDCLGQSSCENGARCFQDSSTCAQSSICVCSTCFYGVRCQFSTSGFGLSLDAILGYHIQPHVSILHQPYAVQFSGVLTIIMVTIGLINGVFSFITFQNKKLRESGCGLYLLGSSITTILTMFLFGIKFCILVYSQITLSHNRVFLYVQCLLIDFFLRIFLTLDQWLNACIATERAIIALKKTGFDKKKSKKVAKYVILVLFALTVSTGIHDPIHRRLFDDDGNDENRIWCIITYSPIFQRYNTAIHFFHFFASFFINMTSAVIIFKANARQKAIIQPYYTRQQLFRTQLQQNNQLIVAPFVLVILALPRVIILFVSGCMKSAYESWLFLIGYFISFVPPICTFFVYVLPSTLYKQEFRKATIRYWKMTKIRCLHNYR